MTNNSYHGSRIHTTSPWDCRYTLQLWFLSIKCLFSTLENNDKKHPTSTILISIPLHLKIVGILFSSSLCMKNVSNCIASFHHHSLPGLELTGTAKAAVTNGRRATNTRLSCIASVQVGVRGYGIINYQLLLIEALLTSGSFTKSTKCGFEKKKKLLQAPTRRRKFATEEKKKVTGKWSKSHQ